MTRRDFPRNPCTWRRVRLFPLHLSYPQRFPRRYPPTERSPGASVDVPSGPIPLPPHSSLLAHLKCRPSVTDIENLWRPIPAWRALPSRRLEEGRRIPNFYIRALKRARQQSAQFAAGHFLQRRHLSHHAQFPLLRKLARKRRILENRRIFALVAPSKSIDWVGSRN